jgi:hypothetical protein
VLIQRLISKGINKNQGKIIPSFFIILYIIVVLLDILTTYLASPDLKLEANPIVRYFNWNWDILLSVVSASIIILVVLVLFANKTIANYNINKTKGKIYISFIIVFVFYTHFTASVFAVVNNLFAYLYLFGKIENIFYKLAEVYIILFKNKSEFLLAIIYSLACTMGLFLTIYNKNRVKGVWKSKSSLLK